MPSPLILIADANTGRGRRVANALERAGHACRVVSQGAAGLEVALSARPRIIVAQVELPLVDANKLAEADKTIMLMHGLAEDYRGEPGLRAVK